MKNRLLPMMFGLFVVLLLAGTYLKAPPKLDEQMLVSLGRPTRMVAQMEDYFKENLFLQKPLRTLFLRLQLATGNRQHNGIYLCNDGLVENFIPSEDTDLYPRNIHAIRQLAADTGLPTALLLLPTASAVYLDRLPPFAGQVQFNQPAFIQRTSEELLGEVAVVDVYPTLYAARSEPLYYRTDSDLTSRGGYLAYTALVRRLGLTPIPATSFHQQFGSTPYYGSLYHQWGYPGIRPDTVSTYHLTTNPPTVRVEHWLRFEQKVYYTLYPTQATVSGNPRDVILGGHSPRIQITNDSLTGSAGNLLLLGDSNALSVLPFLALHYRQITYADPSLLTDSELEALSTQDSTQILFLFSIETFLNSTQPARAAGISRDE